MPIVTKLRSNDRTILKCISETKKLIFHYSLALFYLWQWNLWSIRLPFSHPAVWTPLADTSSITSIPSKKQPINRTDDFPSFKMPSWPIPANFQCEETPTRATTSLEITATLKVGWRRETTWFLPMQKYHLKSWDPNIHLIACMWRTITMPGHNRLQTSQLTPRLDRLE